MTSPLLAPPESAAGGPGGPTGSTTGQQGGGDVIDAEVVDEGKGS